MVSAFLLPTPSSFSTTTKKKSDFCSAATQNVSFLGPLNPFCATPLLRGMKLVVAGLSAGTRRWEVPARQLCREQPEPLSIPARGRSSLTYGFNLFKNLKQSAAGGKKQPGCFSERCLKITGTEIQYSLFSFSASC